MMHPFSKQTTVPPLLEAGSTDPDPSLTTLLLPAITTCIHQAGRQEGRQAREPAGRAGKKRQQQQQQLEVGERRVVVSLSLSSSCSPRCCCRPLPSLRSPAAAAPGVRVGTIPANYETTKAGGAKRMRKTTSKGSGGAKGRAGSSPAASASAMGFDPNKAAELFDAFVPEEEEDRLTMPLEGIVEFARAIGIDDPEGDVRVLVLMWRLGARRRPGQISKEEFTSGLKKLQMDSVEALAKRLVPTLDVDFLQGDDFKDFYKFTFLFSLEGTRRNIEKDMVVELLPMVIGRRSEYTEAFVGFLNETKKEKEMITADQWNQFYDFSLAYPTMDALLKQGNFEEDSSWPILLDEFVDYLKTRSGGGAATNSADGKKSGGGGARK